MIRRTGITALLLTLTALAIAPVPVSQAQSAEVQQHVAALKKSLIESQARLKSYEWIETTSISLKGDEKSRKQSRCYYGVDGAVQKVDVGEAPHPDKKRGVRGKIAENKKEELSEYMQEAVSMVKLYVPPSPEKIQASKDAGKVSLEILQPGKRIRLNFRDYIKPGDQLSVEVDIVAHRVLGVRVATFLDKEKDAVTLDVSFATLPDATNYAQNVILNAPEKKVAVNVTNSGHRKAGG